MGPRLREIKDSVEPTRPPAPVTRWQPVVALIAGLLAVGGVLLAGGDLRWETRVHAQEIREGQEASVAAAREECARSLDRTAGRTQRELADVRERLVRVEESLRWGGTVQTFFRTASRDVEIAGHVIPEGAKVLLFLAAANRDPRKWDDPDRFMITRQASGHVGFGFGIHQCLGQMVARMESEAVAVALLKHVSEIRPAGPLRRRLNNTLHAIGELPVELIPA